MKIFVLLFAFVFAISPMQLMQNNNAIAARLLSRSRRDNISWNRMSNNGNFFLNFHSFISIVVDSSVPYIFHKQNVFSVHVRNYGNARDAVHDQLLRYFKMKDTTTLNKYLNFLKKRNAQIAKK